MFPNDEAADGADLHHQPIGFVLHQVLVLRAAPTANSAAAWTMLSPVANSATPVLDLGLFHASCDVAEILVGTLAYMGQVLTSSDVMVSRGGSKAHALLGAAGQVSAGAIRKVPFLFLTPARRRKIVQRTAKLAKEGIMEIRNCLIITSAESTVAMRSDEVENFSGNLIVTLDKLPLWIADIAQSRGVLAALAAYQDAARADKSGTPVHEEFISS